MKPVEEKTLSKPKGATLSRAGFFYFSDLTFRWNEEFLISDKAKSKRLIIPSF